MGTGEGGIGDAADDGAWGEGAVAAGGDEMVGTDGVGGGRVPAPENCICLSRLGTGGWFWIANCLEVTPPLPADGAVWAGLLLFGPEPHLKARS